MQDLIDRLEKATGPGRIIDWEIHCRNGLDGVGAFGQHPAYTSSIDAARTLVPAWLHWSLTSRGVARVGGGGVEYMLKGGEHEHPAIALSIAALKARANIAGTAAQLEPWKSQA